MPPQRLHTIPHTWANSANDESNGVGIYVVKNGIVPNVVVRFRGLWREVCCGSKSCVSVCVCNPSMNVLELVKRKVKLVELQSEFKLVRPRRRFIMVGVGFPLSVDIGIRQIDCFPRFASYLSE